jgi:hypothetical protein
MSATRTIKLTEKQLQHSSVKAERVEDLTIDECRDLLNWCDWQSSDLWDGMTLQEILNVYRVSVEWDTWEGWAEENRPAAHAAWNSAVISLGNRMRKDATP